MPPHVARPAGRNLNRMRRSSEAAAKELRRSRRSVTRRRSVLSKLRRSREGAAKQLRRSNEAAASSCEGAGGTSQDSEATSVNCEGAAKEQRSSCEGAAKQLRAITKELRERSERVKHILSYSKIHREAASQID